MEATLKNIQAVNEQAKQIAIKNPEFSIQQIEDRIPKVVDSFTGESFSFDAAVSAFHHAHPKSKAQIAKEFEDIMGISVEEYEAKNRAELDSADYSDAQE